MDTEIKRKSIYFSKLVTRKKTDILTETDIIVPDTKPDVCNIVSVKSNVKITGREIQSDRVLIYGNICYRIIYKDDNNCNNCIKTDSSFTDVIDLLGATPGVELSLDYKVKKNECYVLNGRKLALKSTICLDLCAYTTEELEPVYDIVSDDMQKKFGEFKYMSVKNDFEKIFSVNDRVEIPSDRISASEILDVTSNVSDKNVRVINNKVIVKGEVLNNVVYKESESGEIKSIVKNSPFTEIFDVDGIREEDFSYTDISVCNISYGCDKDAIRDIELETEIRGRVYTYKNDVIDLVDDCYSIKQNCEIERNNIKITVPVKSFDEQISVKDKLTCEKGISEILSVSAESEWENVTQENNNLVINGYVSVAALCIDNENMIASIEKKVPYNYTVSVGENTDNCLKDTYSSVTSPSYSLTADGGAEVRFNVMLKGMVYKSEEISPIDNISFKERDGDSNNASITVYFVQENDTLWEVAKKYLTSSEKIKALNNMNYDELKKGTKLFIPKFRL